MTVMTSSDFRQDAGKAQGASSEGPVFVMEGGQPAQVLLSIEEYERLRGSKVTVADLFSCPEAAAIELDIPPRRLEPWREVDLD